MDAQWLKAQFEHHPEKTKAGLALVLGLEPPAISKILNATRQIKAPEYILMRNFFGLPADGGHALDNSPDAFVVSPLNQPENELLEGTNASEAQWIIPAQIMENNTRASSENIKSFRVGDNMMAPDFNRDQHVLVDLSDTAPSPPGTFVVSDGFGFMLRNCEFVPNSDPAQIKITALNDSFQPQTLVLDEFKVFGRVIAKLQWL